MLSNWFFSIFNLLNLSPAPARVPEGPDVLEVDGGDGDLDLLERELLRLGEDVAVEGDEGGAVEVGPLAVAAPGVRLDCDTGNLGLMLIDGGPSGGIIVHYNLLS